MMKFIRLILPQFLDEVESGAVTGKPPLANGWLIDTLSAIGRNRQADSSYRLDVEMMGQSMEVGYNSLVSENAIDQ